MGGEGDKALVVGPLREELFLAAYLIKFKFIYIILNNVFFREFIESIEIKEDSKDPKSRMRRYKFIEEEIRLEWKRINFFQTLFIWHL